MKSGLLFFLFFVPVALISQDLSADEIANKTYEVYKCLGDDRIATAQMAIKDKTGKTTMRREILVLRKNMEDGKKQKWYAYFKRPADIRKMVFLVWKNPSKDDNRWLYLPSLDLVKRLAGSDKRSSFAGSQFVYEDITGRYPESDTHELLGTTDEYYQIKSTPKSSGVEFSYFITEVDKKTFVPLKRTFYDERGQKHRQYKAEKVETIQGFPTIVQFSMTNLQTGESSATRFVNVQYNVGIKDNVFNESHIRRAPRKWLKYQK